VHRRAVVGLAAGDWDRELGQGIQVAAASSDGHIGQSVVLQN
jgi:hypothetical protein